MTVVQVNTRRPSIRSSLVNAVLGPGYRLFRRREVVDGTPAARELKQAQWRPSKAQRGALRLVKWKNRSDVWTMQGAREDGPVVLYLHGGSYWHTPLTNHFLFLRQLVDHTGAQVIFPVYPRAPRYDYRATHRMVLALWQQMLETIPAKRVLFMGDSAGGGLALALAQALRDGELPTPGGLVLLAPWLDTALRNPDIPRQEQLDPMLRRDRILPMAAFYTRGDWDSPLVSPLFGGLRGLPPVWFFQGTRDILYPDAMAFSQKAAHEGCQLDLYVAPGMPHVYPLYPTPEGKAARKEIFRIVADFDRASQ